MLDASHTTTHSSHAEPDGRNSARLLLGVKVKLIIAFCIMAALTVLASGVAWYAFAAIHRSVTRITADAMPGMAASLRLAKKGAEIAASAPSLMASARQGDRLREQANLERKAKELVDLTQALTATGIAGDRVTELAGFESQITARLTELNAAVEGRLAAKQRKDAAIAELATAHANFLETLEPLVDDANFELVMAGEKITGRSEGAPNPIDVDAEALHVLLAVRAEANLAVGLLYEAAGVLDLNLIQPLRERFIASTGHIEAMLAHLPEAARKGGAERVTDALLAFGSGKNSIFDARQDELHETAAAEQSLRTSGTLAVRLNDELGRVVAGAQVASDAAAIRSASTIQTGEALLLVITVLSIAGVTLIAAQYVVPQVVRPIENMTAAMTALAAGSTSVAIPGRDRRDEIGRMAKALAVFTLKHRNLEILLTISKSLGQEIQLDRLLKLMVAEVTVAMEAERSTLFLLDRRRSDVLVSRVAEGVGAREIRVPFGVGIAGATAQTRQTMNIARAYNDRRFDPAFDKSSGFRTRSILATPIVDQSDRLVGVVEVLNKKGGGAFTAEDERFLDAICVHLGIALQRAEMVEAHLQTQIVTKSLQLAREIQMGLVPKDFPALPEFKEVDIFATLIPALEVGGDLYDYFPLDEDRICFIIGDVSDKGVPAALFMAMARSAFKMAAIASPEAIALTISRVNQLLCESNSEQMFVTAFAGILDLRTGRVDYADAGHEPPFILQADRAVRSVFKVGGMVLGFLPSHEFSSGTLYLNPGDALVLYTDGVTEAMNTGRQLFGADAIETALTRAGQAAGSERIIQALLQDLRVHVGEARQSDDIALLVIRYLGRGEARA